MTHEQSNAEQVEQTEQHDRKDNLKTTERWVERRNDNRGPQVGRPQVFLTFCTPVLVAASFAIWEGFHAFSDNVGVGLLLIFLGVALVVAAVLLLVFAKQVFKGWHIGGRRSRPGDDITVD